MSFLSASKLIIRYSLLLNMDDFCPSLLGRVKGCWLVAMQWLFISQFGYCVDVMEKRNSMLGFVDTRNQAIRQTLTITQHLFCDDTFIVEAHLALSAGRAPDFT